MSKETKVIKVIDKGVKEYKRRFVCICEGWDSCFMFSFYDDELSFTEDELVGLTETEVYDLFCKKDREYLQS